jgi:hypothetical protein
VRRRRAWSSWVARPHGALREVLPKQLLKSVVMSPREVHVCAVHPLVGPTPGCGTSAARDVHWRAGEWPTPGTAALSAAMSLCAVLRSLYVWLWGPSDHVGAVSRTVATRVCTVYYFEWSGGVLIQDENSTTHMLEVRYVAKSMERR